MSLRLLSCLLLCTSLLACSDKSQPLDGPPQPPADAGDGSGAYDLWVDPDITVGPPVPLTLATWNVRDLFDGDDDAKHEDTVLTAAQVTTKLQNVGAGLRALAADVVALEEVENLALLNRLNTEQLSSLNYKYVRLVLGNDVRGINVGLLSRFPIPKAISHQMETFPGVDDPGTNYGFSRDCLEATIEAGPGRTLILLINHLAAATEGAVAIKRRHAQAAKVRKIADQNLTLKPDANLAVIGDLNDTPGSDTLNLIENGTPALFDLLTLVPAADRYTHSSKDQLDYIIASPGLKADLTAGSIKADHSAVFKAASDHYPVTARFTIE